MFAVRVATCYFNLGKSKIIYLTVSCVCNRFRRKTFTDIKSIATHNKFHDSRWFSRHQKLDVLFSSHNSLYISFRLAHFYLFSSAIVQSCVCGNEIGRGYKLKATKLKAIFRMSAQHGGNVNHKIQPRYIKIGKY